MKLICMIIIFINFFSFWQQWLYSKIEFQPYLHSWTYSVFSWIPLVPFRAFFWKQIGWNEGCSCQGMGKANFGPIIRWSPIQIVQQFLKFYRTNSRVGSPLVTFLLLQQWLHTFLAPVRSSMGFRASWALVSSPQLQLNSNFSTFSQDH